METIRGHCESRSLCHQVNNHLNQPLLLEGVASVLVALQVAKENFHFCGLVLRLELKQIAEQRKPVNHWCYLLEF